MNSKLVPHTGRLIGYASVSTGDGEMESAQLEALRAVGCRRIFREAKFAGRWDRPQLHRLLDQLRKDDMVVVWKLDRLSHALQDVLHILVRIGAEGAAFRSISEGIDTSTSPGQMLMKMIGTFAEFERAMISKRTNAGLAAALSEGRVLGRPRKLSEATERKLAESVLSGCQSAAAAARLYNVHKATVSRIVTEHRTRGLKDGDRRTERGGL